jgi:hypothetical protein
MTSDAAQQRTWRYRINTSVSTKGVPTWDVTVEGTNFSREEVLYESDQLVAEMRRRYNQPDTEAQKNGN